MKLFLLTTLAMVAFAANSILNRLALAEQAIGAGEFAVVRAFSAAVLLMFLLTARDRAVPRPRLSVVGAASLCLYLVGFSFAYVSLDAGLGALVLFGVVQLVMFAGALLAKETVPPLRYAGAGIAFVGLVVLLAPGAVSLPFWPVVLMVAAAIEWGVYSLNGRDVADPLEATAFNFVWASVGAGVIWLLLPGQSASGYGYALAVASGAVTSGLGYALWYAVLPALGASRAAAAQLTVPVIAAVGGVALLGEALTLQFMLASVLVLGGVGLSLRR